MSKRKRLLDLVGPGLAAAFILAACSPGATTAAPATQTAAPATQTASPQPALPTATETASPTATASALPSATATETPTITPTEVTAAQVMPGWNAYCRMGPGTYYFAITYLTAGNMYPVVGRDGQDIWWRVQVSPSMQCWMGDPTSTVEGPVELTPLVLAPPLPSSPSSFLNTSHCDKDLNTMTVWLTWNKAGGATGYNIYRNGDLITTQGPKVIAYTDKAPRGVNLKYQIEAFNEYGVSPRLATKISACI